MDNFSILDSVIKVWDPSHVLPADHDPLGTDQLKIAMKF